MLKRSEWMSNRVSVERRPGELLTPMTAIRSHCLGCCGSSSEVALCTVTSCPLWPLRFKTGKRARKIVAEERTLDDVKDNWWAERLKDYTAQGHYRVARAELEGMPHDLP